MDNNLPAQPTVVPPSVVAPPPAVAPQPETAPLPPAPQYKSHIRIGMTLAMVVALVIIVLVLLMSGYLLLFHKTQTATHNAQVYQEPTTTVSPTVSPVPENYQINPQDTSDNAINQDAQATGQDLNNLNSDLNNVDQSFNDQQTNLQ